jgi:hypothetical protein
MMKKYLLALLAAALSLPAYGQTAVTTLLGAVITTGAGTAMTTDDATGVCVHIFSATSSSATVKIQQSLDGTNYASLATITDPDSAGEMWCGPGSVKTRANVTARASGTLSAKAFARTIPGDPVGQLWKQVDSTGLTISYDALTVSGLTAGRVLYAGTGGALTDEAALAYDAGTNVLTAGTFTGAFSGSTLTASSLTTTRVPFATTAGLLEDEAAFVYTKATNTLTVDVITGTAAALTSNPTDCAANNFATTIAASGNLSCAQPAVANLSDGSTGAGLVQLATLTVEESMVSKTPTGTESGELYTNTGDADGSTITLTNDPTVGTFFRIALVVAQTITLAPSAGETLYLGGDNCAASLTANAIGAVLDVVAIKGGAGGIWTAHGTNWTCND